MVGFASICMYFVLLYFWWKVLLEDKCPLTALILPNLVSGTLWSWHPGALLLSCNGVCLPPCFCSREVTCWALTEASYSSKDAFSSTMVGSLGRPGTSKHLGNRTSPQEISSSSPSKTWRPENSNAARHLTEAKWEGGKIGEFQHASGKLEKKPGEKNHHLGVCGHRQSILSFLYFLASWGIQGPKCHIGCKASWPGAFLAQGTRRLQPGNSRPW